MDRREQIIDCARKLIEKQGLAKTSVRAITDEIGVTRTLFYHYFPSKDELVGAVLDAYVADFVAALQRWNDNRVEGDIEGALDSVVAFLRSEVLGENAHNPFRRALATHENASLYLEFTNRVADSVSRYIVESTVRDYGRLHEVRIDHVYETFYILVLGLIGFMRQHPDADDSVLKDLISQSLHMERGCKAPNSLVAGRSMGGMQPNYASTDANSEG